MLIIPVPVPKSNTFALFFISFAKSDRRTLSIPKQNPFLFWIIFNPLYSKSSILSFSFNKILIPLFYIQLFFIFILYIIINLYLFSRSS